MTNAFSATGNNEQPISHYPAEKLNEVGASKATMQVSGFDGVHSWYDDWKACS